MDDGSAHNSGLIISINSFTQEEVEFVFAVINKKFKFETKCTRKDKKQLLFFCLFLC